MEHVTQRAAANTEESASAVTELNAQSGALTDLAHSLLTIVGSRGSSAHA